MKRIKNLAILLTAGIFLTSCGASKYAMNSSYPIVGNEIKYDGILEECMHDCSLDGPKK